MNPDGTAGDGPSIPQPTVAELQSDDNQTNANKQLLFSQIPWTHHTILLDKAKTMEERIFYPKEVIRNGWTKNMLKVNIDTCLYNRQGKAITNFDSKLSENQAELQL
ncbi:DUF1016 N-terminal domain-containing protein [Niastella caeni]|uniref:DUF1016 N-terminal domain-containing protein n=1 Tax=Niastella caeni TaxID=2569763 RepID=UPI00140DD445|nr:DUF1016 N-terminal domain-containing protein [Niastella caeni]